MLIQYHKQFGKHPKDPYKGFVDGDREDQRINDDKIEEFKTEKRHMCTKKQRSELVFWMFLCVHRK